MNAILQAVLSTLFTYALTAAGAAGVYCLKIDQNDPSRTRIVLAVAAGFMLSAVTELFTACTELSASMGWLAWIPTAVGFFVACSALWGLNYCIERRQQQDATMLQPLGEDQTKLIEMQSNSGSSSGIQAVSSTSAPESLSPHSAIDTESVIDDSIQLRGIHAARDRRRQAYLLVFALAIQHVPEALACGVAFAVIYL